MTSGLLSKARPDAVIAEVHRQKRAIMAEHGDDVEKLLKDLRNRQKANPRLVFNRPSAADKEGGRPRPPANKTRKNRAERTRPFSSHWPLTPDSRPPTPDPQSDPSQSPRKMTSKRVPPHPATIPEPSISSTSQKFSRKS